ncbi:hypothetical protein [Roseibium sp. RKSG952]|uniref:hypothetical protein n=1 Tax=Roseibium sp. RKSG952 TaxID=2529384 RepID=UPI0012BB8124|nr:hypothetical protein [Roseibium sp. RKSG952]MTH96004.1 hypothetical protein [Roseibium sp. RKSG952]
MAQAQQKKNVRKPATAPGIRKDFNRLEAASKPWWTEALSVAQKCAALAFAPFRLVVAALDAAVAGCFLGLVVVVWMWWTERIPDQLVSEVVAKVGDRILAIVKDSGII